MIVDPTDQIDQLELAAPMPLRLLLLDDEAVNLMLRATILRKHGYDCIPASTYEDAIELFDRIDIAVLDYHLGAGKFGSEVATLLRKRHPEIPIIIVSATLDHYFGGVEDVHLLKGYSSTEDLLGALRSLDAKRRGSPVFVDPSQFFYSRICRVSGAKALVQIFDAQGLWVYCNEAAADYLGRHRDWFPGRNIQSEMGHILRNWQKVVLDVVARRETYIDGSRQGLLNFPHPASADATWSVLAYPIALHDGEPGVMLSATVLDSPRSPKS
ncbi:response regulator [Granulicella arctica]|uniref:response regulator n=1 Tax=Granulicella arctica TaxID=940613 RepID=UPI0021E01057|nr:response regulator [Granulicella arctica]